MENFTFNTPSNTEKEMKSVTPIPLSQNTDVLQKVANTSGLSEEQIKQIVQLSPTTNKMDGTIKLDIDIKAPAGIDTKQLELALSDPKIREAMIKHINNAKSNDGAKGWMKK